MLDHLETQHEGPAPEFGGKVVVGRAYTEVETGCPGVGNAFLRRIDAGNLEPFGRKHARGGAVAAAEIEDALGAALGHPGREDLTHGRPEIAVRAGRLGRVPPITGEIGACGDSTADRESRFCHRPPI